MWRDADSITADEIQQVILKATKDYDIAAQAEAEADAAMSMANRTLDHCDYALTSTDPEIVHNAKTMVSIRWNEWYGTHK